jgi:hypothetical protein
VGPESWEVTNAHFGEATLLEPGQPNPARGIKFKDGILGIGVRQGPNESDPISGVVDMSAVGKVNTMVARVINDDPDHPTPTIKAEFRLAGFGLGPGGGAIWEKIPSQPNPSVGRPIPKPATANDPPTPVDLTSDWTIAQGDKNKYEPLWDDQCLWAQLSSAAGPANIVEETMRRNLTVKKMSEYAGGFTVSGVGHPPPPHGSRDYTMLLHTVKVPLDRTSPDLPGYGDGYGYDGYDGGLGLVGSGGGPPPPPPPPKVASWLWVTNGYRTTGRTLTLGGKRYAVTVHTGSFGHLFDHELAAGETRDTVDLHYDFGGGGIQKHSDAYSTLRVRQGGSATVRTAFVTGPPRPTGGIGLLAWLLWLLRVIRRLLGR